MEKKLKKQTFFQRVKSMLKVDGRRLFLSPLLYIMIGISFVVPILILVMTTMMEGTVTVNPQTNLPSEPMEGFDNVWQILGAVSSTSGDAAAGMSMDLVSMCNINMMFFAVVVLVCIFVCDDFRSGYAKNLFTVRAKKSDYVLSKTVIGFLGASAMFIAFFIGAIIGGGVASLPFEMSGFNTGNLVACMLSKLFLTLVFVAVCVLASVIGKQKTWLSMIVSLGFSMLFFTIIPMITPLDSTILNVLLCGAGGILFAVGIGAISNTVLNKTSLV
ncbi:MAG: hypothetical protein E7377_05685 [Clostridiales bacterium]|nr:hypothetical protein [Clostridiales bacterium]